MAVDDELRAMVQAHLSTLDGVIEKPIVGGTGFTWHGHLLCGVMAAALLVRVARGDHDTFLADDGAGPLVMGGRSLAGWILVRKSVVQDPRVLTMWVDRALAFVGSLPEK